MSLTRDVHFCIVLVCLDSLPINQDYFKGLRFLFFCQSQMLQHKQVGGCFDCIWYRLQVDFPCSVPPAMLWSRAKQDLLAWNCKAAPTHRVGVQQPWSHDVRVRQQWRHSWRQVGWSLPYGEKAELTTDIPGPLPPPLPQALGSRETYN